MLWLYYLYSQRIHRFPVMRHFPIDFRSVCSPDRLAFLNTPRIQVCSNGPDFAPVSLPVVDGDFLAKVTNIPSLRCGYFRPWL